MELPVLLEQARACRMCEASLPMGPRPLLQASGTSRVLVIGQAPGAGAHERGTPWDDPSGRRLRDWLGTDDETFYDEARVALMPMGFCYPGKGRSGDMPPRPECAPLWHPALLDALGRVELTVFVGQYAFRRYLADMLGSMTEAVAAYASLLPDRVALPHPSPRNNMWLKRNPWFDRDVLPALRRRVEAILA